MDNLFNDLFRFIIRPAETVNLFNVLFEVECSQLVILQVCYQYYGATPTFVLCSNAGSFVFMFTLYCLSFLYKRGKTPLLYAGAGVSLVCREEADFFST